MIKIGEMIQSIHAHNLSINTLRPSIILVWQNNKEDFRVMLSEVRLRPIQKVDSEEEGKEKPVEISLKHNPYSAPQLFKDNPRSLSSDIWSLGLIYYEILSGRAIDTNILNIKLEIIYDSDIEKWIPNFIDRLVNEDAKSRYKIGDILKILKNAKLCCK